MYFGGFQTLLSPRCTRGYVAETRPVSPKLWWTLSRAPLRPSSGQEDLLSVIRASREPRGRGLYLLIRASSRMDQNPESSQRNLIPPLDRVTSQQRRITEESRISPCIPLVMLPPGTSRPNTQAHCLRAISLDVHSGDQAILQELLAQCSQPSQLILRFSAWYSLPSGLKLDSPEPHSGCFHGGQPPPQPRLYPTISGDPIYHLTSVTPIFVTQPTPRTATATPSNPPGRMRSCSESHLTLISLISRLVNKPKTCVDDFNRQPREQDSGM